MTTLLKTSVVMLLIAVVAFLASTTLSSEPWAIAATVAAACSAVAALFLYAVNRSAPGN